MSVELVYNGNFSLPDISENTNYSVTSLSAQQRQQLFWNMNGMHSSFGTYLADGSLNIFPSPSLVGATQYISTFGNGYLNQEITILKTGTYNLSFKYSARIGSTFNNARIYFGNTLFDTITTAPSGNTWATYSNNYNCTQAGTTNLRFVGNDPSGVKWIGITNVSLTPVSLDTDLTYNNLKDTNVYGYLTTNDLNQNGVTTNSGYIQTPQLITDSIRFNYLSLPSFNSSNLGYVSTVTYSGGTPIGANTFASISFSSLPVGTYFIDSVVTFSYTLNTLARLGLNTVNNAFNIDYNYSSFYSNISSSLSVKYNYILQNTEVKTYYVIFSPSASVSTVTQFTASAVRMA
jgi:hypothetical protein